ncbi:hypothetical protein Tco_1014010 [Tanacetum coccineum]
MRLLALWLGKLTKLAATDDAFSTFDSLLIRASYIKKKLKAKGDDDCFLCSVRSLPRPISWLGTYTMCVIAAMSGVRYRTMDHFIQQDPFGSDQDEWDWFDLSLEINTPKLNEISIKKGSSGMSNGIIQMPFLIQWNTGNFSELLKFIEEHEKTPEARSTAEPTAA